MRTSGAESSLADAVAAHLAQSEAPVPLVTRLRRAGVAVKNDALGQLLQQLAREGRAFEHPVGRQARNPSPRYWHRSAEDYVERTLAQALERGVTLGPTTS